MRYPENNTQTTVILKYYICAALVFNCAARQHIDEIVVIKMRSSNQRAGARTRGRVESVATASMRTDSTSDVRFDPIAVRVEPTSTGTTASRNNDTTNNDDAYTR